MLDATILTPTTVSELEVLLEAVRPETPKRFQQFLLPLTSLEYEAAMAGWVWDEPLSHQIDRILVALEAGWR